MMWFELSQGGARRGGLPWWMGGWEGGFVWWKDRRTGQSVAWQGAGGGVGQTEDYRHGQADSVGGAR